MNFPPHNICTKRAIFFAKYCNKPVKSSKKVFFFLYGPAIKVFFAASLILLFKKITVNNKIRGKKRIVESFRISAIFFN